jgi:hypothetical protein
VPPTLAPSIHQLQRGPTSRALSAYGEAETMHELMMSTQNTFLTNLHRKRLSMCLIASSRKPPVAPVSWKLLGGPVYGEVRNTYTYSPWSPGFQVMLHIWMPVIDLCRGHSASGCSKYEAHLHSLLSMVRLDVTLIQDASLPSR